MVDKAQVTMSDDELDNLLSEIENEIGPNKTPQSAQKVEAAVEETLEETTEEVVETTQPESVEQTDEVNYDEILNEVPAANTPTTEEPTADFSDAADEEADGIYVRKSKPVLFDPEQFAKDLTFSKFQLDEAMMKQPGLYAYYAEVAARLQRRADQCKVQLELLESNLDTEIRSEAASAGTKVTEVMVEKAIKRNPEYLKTNSRYLDAKMQANMAKDMLEALKQRRDMLIQIGKDKREELAGEVRVMSADSNLESAKQRVLSSMKKGQ